LTSLRGALTVFLALAAPDGIAQAPSTSSGLAYPTKPIRIIVPFAPGGANDLVTRLVAQKLAAGIGQSVVVENRGGAGGTIGLDICAKAPPDGYTLVMAPTSAVAFAPSLNAKLSYDPVRDFAPITSVSSGPNVLVVHPSVPATTLKDFIALARAKTGRLSYASSGATSMSGLAGEMFKLMAGVDMVGVPYKGTGPAMTDLIGGQVDLMFADLAISLPHVHSRRLRAIAVTGPKRSVHVMQIPTVVESGVPGYTLVNWRGVLAPAATSREIVVKLNAEIIRTLRAPDIRESLAREGFEPIGDTPEQFAALIKAEVARYAKLIKAAGISGQL
jgi:tripartite-type tricarboxylate transporter receptor subunit TctC